eukprot:TRINITY_DN15580_c0_g2_i1.p1 TRINITY_DN15580_c0_g2~~TRINITY_DN15580_c0_g2_i1.p1  ORF type:complete len:525 (+),score=39.56 TRINITY_DN15580_c0_g2_i1:88-1575(+)
MANDNRRLQTELQQLVTDHRRAQTELQQMANDNRRLRTALQEMETENHRSSTELQQIANDNHRLQTELRQMANEKRELQIRMRQLSRTAPCDHCGCVDQPVATVINDWQYELALRLSDPGIPRDLTWLRIGRRLGERIREHVHNRFYGANAAVFEAWCVFQPNHPLALRLLFNLDPNVSNSNQIQLYNFESHVLTYNNRQLPWHPNVMRLFHSMVASLPADLHLEDVDRSLLASKTVFTLMPLYRLSLQQHLSRRAMPFSEAEVVHLGLGIAAGLEHLHSHRIVHRDLKPDNIMLGWAPDTLSDEEQRLLDDHKQDVPESMTLRCVPVVSDLGEALNAETDHLDGFRLPYVTHHISKGGAKAYWPPEISDAHHGPHAVLDYSNSDAFALGCVLFQLMTGRAELKWSSNDEEAAAQPGAVANGWVRGSVRLENVEDELRSGYLRDLGVVHSEELRGVVLGLLRADPAARLTLDQAWDQLRQISSCQRCHHVHHQGV